MNTPSRRAFVATGLAFLATPALAAPNLSLREAQQIVDRIVVFKESRRLYLYKDDRAVRNYRFDLGWSPIGHKQFEGDGRTPEGAYMINRRNPNSNFYLSLGISYPNEEDRAYASSKGKPPGGDIFIHGHTGTDGNYGDWTAGCIAVRNREMEQIYAMVRPGTPILIVP